LCGSELGGCYRDGMTLDDAALLRSYATEKSEAAFAELV
jgi:hypothetical protein